MKRYIPDWRKSPANVRRRFGKRKPRDPFGARIPPNSDPWLEHPPRSIADLIRVSDAISEAKRKWKLPLKNS